ncbi:MerR family transcriptional regulator [Arthrobacter sp. TMN-49]
MSVMTRESVFETTSSGGLTVGSVASKLGVTVRTLHHWDAMRLVCPSERTLGGYRLYSSADVARIHRVLIYRELGPLEKIEELLDTSAIEAEESLRTQRAQLVERISRLQGMVASVDRMIEATSAGILLSAEEQVAIFGQHWQPSWPEEARTQWGDTAQWAEYAQRSVERTADDWRRVAETTSGISDDLAAAKRAGLGAGSAQANSLAEWHRASISDYFHCTHSMHVCLGKMYVADAAYADFYDAIEPGLTLWLQEIIDANVSRAMSFCPPAVM